jgi:hypothetical protein
MLSCTICIYRFLFTLNLSYFRSYYYLHLQLFIISYIFNDLTFLFPLFPYSILSGRQIQRLLPTFLRPLFDPLLGLIFDSKFINLDTEHFKKAVMANVGEYTFQEGELGYSFMPFLPVIFISFPLSFPLPLPLPLTLPLALSLS